MEIIKSIDDIRASLRIQRKNGKIIGFIPTMGYLHDGHISLVIESKSHSNFQVMSIFVNPMQFNDPVDFKNYPIDLERDFILAEKAGIDLVFLPNVNEIYRDRLTFVDMELLTDHLCGSARPGHFRGVLTIVFKLFNIIQPDVAVFGQKDIQQALAIQKMTLDLDFPIRIIIAPTIREKDGLAMSSRNVRLTSDERQRSTALHKALRTAGEMIESGERSSEKIISELNKIFIDAAPNRIDYITIARLRDLQPTALINEGSVLALAVFFGSTRLIDNMLIEYNEGSCKCRY
jgi:pantoate--beta-alanine ligase